MDGESDALISSKSYSYWLCNDATNDETYLRKKKYHIK